MAIMRNTLHANLGHGGYRYEYEDGLGSRCTAVRPARNQPERTFWTHDLLPDREFPDYAAVNSVLLNLTRADIATEQGKYPRLAPIERDSCGNRCCLCSRIPGGSPIGTKYETWHVELKTSWQHSRWASLCDAHRDEFADKPDELLAALKAEVAERKARSKANLDSLCAVAAPKD